MRTARAGLTLLTVFGGLTGALVVATAAPAGAANASGCSGSGTSIGASGLAIDQASAPGGGGTKDNPFQVETGGRVRYQYTIKGPIGGGTWKAVIDTGLPFVGNVEFSGRIKSSSQPSGKGVEPLKKHLQFAGIAAVVGAVKVKIVATSGHTRCVVSGWIKINDSPVKSAMFYESLLLLLFAIIFFYLAMMGQLPEEALDASSAMAQEALGENVPGDSA
jgi:hypothetical protein